MRVRDVMCATTDLLHPDHPMEEARRRLQEAGISMLPVVDGDEIVGVLSRSESGGGGEPSTLPRPRVRDCMSSAIPLCRDDETLEEVARAMEQEGQSGLIVLDAEDQMVGVVTREMLAAAGVVARVDERRRHAPGGAHEVKSASRAREEKQGRRRSYSVKPHVVR